MGEAFMGVLYRSGVKKAQMQEIGREQQPTTDFFELAVVNALTSITESARDMTLEC